MKDCQRKDVVRCNEVATGQKFKGRAKPKVVQGFREGKQIAESLGGEWKSTVLGAELKCNHNDVSVTIKIHKDVKSGKYEYSVDLNARDTGNDNSSDTAEEALSKITEDLVSVVTLCAKLNQQLFS